MNYQLYLTIGVCVLLPACGKQSSKTSERQNTTRKVVDTTKLSDKKQNVITAPPEVVVPLETLKTKYGWNGDTSLARVTQSASMMRERRGSSAVFVLQDIAVGNLAVSGECYFDETSFHLLKGQAHVVHLPPAEQHSSAALPTTETYAAWAAFLEACTDRGEQVTALRHLQAFYQPSTTNQDDISVAEWSLKPPSGRTIQTVPLGNGKLSFSVPVESVLTYAIKAGVGKEEVTAAFQSTLIRTGKHVMLFRDSAGRLYAKIGEEDKLWPLIRDREIPAAPSPDDPKQRFVEYWRISAFLEMLHKLDRTPVSLGLCELCAELPIPEAYNTLTKLPENFAAEHDADIAMCMMQWATLDGEIKRGQVSSKTPTPEEMIKRLDQITDQLSSKKTLEHKAK